VTTPTNQRLGRTIFFGSAELQGAGMVLSSANLTCGFDSARLDLRSVELATPEVTYECSSYSVASNCASPLRADNFQPIVESRCLIC
jgi:hypothetical protein